MDMPVMMEESVRVPAGDMAPVLAQALKLGIRLVAAAGLCDRRVPPEVQAMLGALQQYERSLRHASNARLVGPHS